eukprot:986372_1
MRKVSPPKPEFVWLDVVYPSCPVTQSLCYVGRCSEDCSRVPVQEFSASMSTYPEASGYRTDRNDCPTLRTCPAELPVRCTDASCRGSIAECPTSQCVFGTRRCSDGTCVVVNAVTITTCSTGSTCPENAPYKCADGTCSATLSDCTPERQCPEDTPVLCQEGDCVLNVRTCNSRNTA